LVEHFRVVPGAVIYLHTHHFLVQHQIPSPEPPNDFAYWVTNTLLEETLGQELAAINLMRFSAIRDVGNALVSVIERHLERKTLRTAPAGEKFHFKQSASFVVPTGLRVFRCAAISRRHRARIDRVDFLSNPRRTVAFGKRQQRLCEVA
jgi:hypothetical protein